MTVGHCPGALGHPETSGPQSGPLFAFTDASSEVRHLRQGARHLSSGQQKERGLCVKEAGVWLFPDGMV